MLHRAITGGAKNVTIQGGPVPPEYEPLRVSIPPRAPHSGVGRAPTRVLHVFFGEMNSPKNLSHFFFTAKR